MRDGQKRDLARALRRSGTGVEQMLWRRLRDRRLARLKFRRQVPIGPYVADFACAELRLVVELDGGQHSNARDARRDAFLMAQGWRILRFWNNEAAENPEGVLLAICEAAGVEFGRE